MLLKREQQEEHLRSLAQEDKETRTRPHLATQEVCRPNHQERHVKLVQGFPELFWNLQKSGAPRFLVNQDGQQGSLRFWEKPIYPGQEVTPEMRQASIAACGIPT